MPVLLSVIEPIVVSRIGANASNDSSATLKDGRWATTSIRRNIVGGDAIIINAILANAKHPRRGDYMTGYSSDHAHASVIESAAGAVEEWEVKVNASDSVYIAAKPSTILEIEAMRAGGIGTAAHNDANSPIGAYLNVGKDLKVRFTGALARFRKPAFVPDYTTFVLQSPAEMAEAVIAASIGLCKKPGDIVTDVFARADRALSFYLSLIGAGEVSMPSMDEAAERAAQMAA